MRPAVWGIVGAFVFFTLYLISLIPSFFAQVTSAKGVYAEISATLLFLAIISFPTGLLFELGRWGHGKISGKSERKNH
ncbi:hypothetical protein AKJ37_05960 [candidate division MSBL1 archaeon SCGC-AAA259I09]|uniref:Uncharacterized protein n=3 Tax=candidate division MSBL1 TaxID=215777 RepID=A0A133UPT5_9EURY|nr:hypothetical protein AKJ62_00965 [candidate division MSBL1 archaeon SCGC-AAA259D14]KXA93383.1 hypothetical protein AKJ66_02175 [candidate division MSBL1 archaeon SCGC-AAA259E22]KXA96136.1 hypothetical protein AKJ37_05960 [candidate division MSBL1 archaeon SCGC-AAA259I09]